MEWWVKCGHFVAGCSMIETAGTVTRTENTVNIIGNYWDQELNNE